MSVLHESRLPGREPHLKEENRFSEETVAAAWRRSDGRCECHDAEHGHELLRCQLQLVWAARGASSQPGAWEAVSLSDNRHHSDFSLGNCRIVCRLCQLRRQVDKFAGIAAKMVDGRIEEMRPSSGCLP